MSSINKDNLSINDETFIPLEIALNYLVDSHVLSRLKTLYVIYQGFARNIDQGVRASEEVYLDGIAMIKNINLTAIWPYRKEKFISIYGSLSFCYGRLNGEEFDWFDAPKVFDVGENKFVNDNNVYVKQSDLDALAKKYGISKLHKEVITTPDAIRKITIKRENNYNTCLAEVINRFTQQEMRKPNVEEVLDSLISDPPQDNIVSKPTDRNTISINGSTPKPISSLKRTIKSLLDTL